MNDPARHVEEEAELYALGLLEPDERARVDEHAFACAPCAARLGAAESAVAALLDAAAAPAPHAAQMPAPPGRNVRAPWAYAAAGVLLVAAAAGVRDARTNGAPSLEGTVLHAMVESHFAHTPFVAARGGAFAAKVIYEPHGAWYAVVATGTHSAWRVAVRRAAAAALVVPPAPLEQRGDVAVAWLTSAGSVAEIVLLDARGDVLARAHPHVGALAR